MTSPSSEDGGAPPGYTPLVQITAPENRYMPADETQQYARLSESALAELEQVTEQAVANGIREGLRSVITDDEYMVAFWTKGVEVAKKQATLKAGSLLMTSMTDVLKTISKVMVIGLIMYYLGGWDLVARTLKFFFTGDK